MAETFGQMVREARGAARLSQEALAARCDSDQTTISQIERGVFKPRYELVLRLARALNVPEESGLLAAGYTLPGQQEAEPMSPREARVWRAMKANTAMMMSLDRCRRYEAQETYERVLDRAFQLTAAAIDIELARLDAEKLDTSAKVEQAVRQARQYARPATLAEAYDEEEATVASA